MFHFMKENMKVVFSYSYLKYKKKISFLYSVLNFTEISINKNFLIINDISF